MNDKEIELIETADAQITHPKKRAMIEALINTRGIVTTAADMVGINPRTHYTWKKTDELYRELSEEADLAAVDFARSKLYELMDGVKMIGDEGQVYHTPPNVAALIFYLKTKGGFVERKHIDLNANVKHAPFSGIDLSVEDAHIIEEIEGSDDEN